MMISSMKDYADPKQKMREIVGRKSWLYVAYFATITGTLLLLYGIGSAIGS